MIESKQTQRSESQDVHPWDQAQLARHPDRPCTADLVHLICEDFFTLRGDRRYADNQAILGGLATFAERTVIIIGHQKGRGSEQRQVCNAGMAHPEGYRKAQRLMHHAEKFGFPVICLIDTPGAFPGLEAEQRGPAQAIAECLACMVTLRVPTIAVVIGEGGSEGAMALSLADRVLMLEHSIYTVASPEVTASLLGHDSSRAPQAAEIMQITAPELLRLGVIDGIIPEPPGGAHLNHAGSAQFLSEYVHKFLLEIETTPISDLVGQRQMKFRQPGQLHYVTRDLCMTFRPEQK